MRSKQQVKDSANAEVAISDYLPFCNHVSNNVIKLKNGEYIAEGNYVEGNQDGMWIQLYADGKKAFEGEYFEGLENGVHKFYFNNGKPKEERKYRLGLKEGDWKVWDESGELLLTTTYERGEVRKMEGVKVKRL